MAAARAAAEAGENRVSARLGGPWASSRGQLGKRLKLAADPGDGSLLARFAAGDVGGVRGSSRPSAEVSLSVSASESTLGLGVVFGVVVVPWVAVAAVGVEVGRIGTGVLLRTAQRCGCPYGRLCLLVVGTLRVFPCGCGFGW